MHDRDTKDFKVLPLWSHQAGDLVIQGWSTARIIRTEQLNLAPINDSVLSYW